jgi:small-conductance mechanosensitive channel
MDAVIQPLLDHLRGDLPGILRALLIALVGLPLARIVGRLLQRAVGGAASPERATLARRAGFWAVVALAVASALRELGFDLSVVMGAAGVLSVAVGFASQTSASNVISGLFLIGERPFSVGDWIRIGATEGEVIAIDLLSVKLRTADNLFVRVPNEVAMKSEITNLTRFPIRRIDLRLTVPYEQDLDRARATLLAALDDHPLTLTEPRPVVRFIQYADAGVVFQAGVWVTTAAFIGLKDELPLHLKRSLDAAGVPMALPSRRLSTGEGQAPLRIELVQGERGGPSPPEPVEAPAPSTRPPP